MLCSGQIHQLQEARLACENIIYGDNQVCVLDLHSVFPVRDFSTICYLRRWRKEISNVKSICQLLTCAAGDGQL